VPVGPSEKMYITAGENKRVPQTICTHAKKSEWTRETNVYSKRSNDEAGGKWAGEGPENHSHGQPYVNRGNQTMDGND